MTSEFWTPQAMIALTGVGGVVIGGLITWGVQTQLAKRKFAFDKDLAERQFAHNKELADKKLISDKDLADRNFAQEKAQRRPHLLRQGKVSQSDAPHCNAVGLVGEVGIVVHQPLKSGHDLFASKVGWRAKNFSTSEFTSRREPAGEGACNDLGDGCHSGVGILPISDESPSRRVGRTGPSVRRPKPGEQD